MERCQSNYTMPRFLTWGADLARLVLGPPVLGELTRVMSIVGMPLSGVVARPLYAYTGFWAAGILGVCSVFSLSNVVSYLTRFTDEIFAALISVIFIFEAILNVTKLYFADDTITGRARAS